jgi:hypothetical protein
MTEADTTPQATNTSVSFSPDTSGERPEKGVAPLRRQTLVKFSFNDIKENIKIDNRDISQVVKNRFLGQNYLTEDLEDASKPVPEKELPENTIVRFIVQFGLVELNEVDNILLRDHVQQPPEVNEEPRLPQKIERTPIKEEEEQRDSDEYGYPTFDNGDELLPTKLPEKIPAKKPEKEKLYVDREPFTFAGEKLLDSQMFLEDIQGEHLLDTEFVSSVNFAIDGHYSGTICSYAVSTNSPSIVLIGTENGELLEVRANEKNPIKKHSMESKVTAVALSPNDEYLVAGSVNSELLFKKTEGKIAKKYIKNLNQQKISHLVFVDNSSVLVATVLNVYFFSITSYTLLLEVSMTSVVPRQPFTIMQVSPIVFEDLLRIVVVMNDRLCLYSMVREDKKEPIVYKIGRDIEDPDVEAAPANNKWPPMVDWIEPGPNSATPCFILFWKNKISLVEFRETEYHLAAQRTVLANIAWGSVLDNSMFCLINSNLEIELISLERVFAPEYVPETLHAKFPILSGILKDQRDINYMTKFKDRLQEADLDLSMKLPFFQFFRNRLKERGPFIYMITDKGLMRYAPVTIERLVDIYLVKGEASAAVRLLNNVFLGTVFVKDSEYEALRQLTPQVVDAYVRSKLATDLLVEDQARLIDTAIESLVCSENTDAIFDVVKNKFTPKLFWNEVSKFIRERYIKSIPYGELAHGAQYLDNEEVVELLREFRIESTEDDDQTINRVLMIIKKKNIWPFLYKFCIFYPSQSIFTFLTMLAAEIITMDKKVRDTILDEAIFKSTDGMDLDRYFDEPNRRLFFRLFWFFNLVLSPGNLKQNMIHFTADPNQVLKNIPDIYEKTLEWILDSNNANIILQTSSQIFFELILECVLNVELLSAQKVVELIRNIKNVYLKKNETTNDLKFVANFRATQNLSIDTYAFCVAENILMILESLLGEKYTIDIAFVAIKALCFGTHDRRYENQEWLCWNLLTLLARPYEANRFWLSYKPISQDKFEDIIITACSNLEHVKAIDEIKKKITNTAFENK